MLEEKKKKTPIKHRGSSKKAKIKKNKWLKDKIYDYPLYINHLWTLYLNFLFILVY